MRNLRKRPIYGNCKVLAPDGELMFRCLEKKANWYLDRNLAIIIDDDPLTIQLNFEPNGRGEKTEYLKSIRKNKCVVCGEEDLEVLTKHHLIPYEYRRHFPYKLKSHNSGYVVPICISCHEKYERDHANVLKVKLASEFGAPKNGNTNKRYHAEKHILALLRHRDRMPEKRLKYVQELFVKTMADAGIETNESIFDDKALENYLEFFKSNDETVDNRHGKQVVDNCPDLEAFSQSWIKHFLDSMNPKFMPKYLA